MKMLLEARNLHKSYQKRPIVQNLSLEVNKGEVVGLLGPNGAGKSTAFYLLTGLIKPDKGQVLLLGKDVTCEPMHQRALLGLGYLAQDPCVFGTLTVEDNIRCVLETLDISKEQQNQRLDQLLNELHISHLLKKKAMTLSGGERRRLELCRVLATDLKCLLLDEPFANIDPMSIQEVKHLIGLLCKKGIGVLITDHNAREIFSIADRCYIMQAGTILAAGSTKELINDELARKHYLGMDFQI